MAKVYLILSILGTILPYSAFILWLSENGIDFIAFFRAIIENPISLFAWLDVIIASIALLIFIVIDGRKNQVKYRWYTIIGTLFVGVSCGLPLYLFLKTIQYPSTTLSS